MRSNLTNPNPKTQSLPNNTHNTLLLPKQSHPYYNHIDYALQTLDNAYSLRLLQSLDQLSPQHLCLKTKLAHLLDQHHSCLDFSTQSLLVTPRCPPCLDIFLQHFSSKNEWNLTLRSKLIDSLSQNCTPELFGYLMKINQLAPRAQRYRHLIEQLRRDKCSLEKVQILEMQDNYRIIIATADIKKDEQILFIPKDKLITLELARTLPLVQKLMAKRNLLKSPKHTELAVFLLHQFEKGQQSPFYNYLSTLPNDFSRFPINYSEAMMNELTGTCFLEQIESKKSDLAKDYDIVLSVDERFARFSFERFVEVRLLVCSRVFGIIMERNKTDAMVPLADMLNHQLPKQTGWYYCDTMKGFVIQSLQDISIGAEIFDSYGQKCNSRFLLNYGFTIPNNTHNQVTLTLNLLPSFKFTNVPSNAKVRVSRILESKSFQDMMSMLRVAASCKEAVDCDSDEEESVENVKHVAFKSIQNQIKAMQLLQNLILERLKDYPTTLNQDKKLLQKAEGVLADIITLRMGQKEVFQYYLTMAKKMCRYLGNRSKRSELAAYETYIASLQLEGRSQQ